LDTEWLICNKDEAVLADLHCAINKILGKKCKKDEGNDSKGPKKKNIITFNDYSFTKSRLCN